MIKSFKYVLHEIVKHSVDVLFALQSISFFPVHHTSEMTVVIESQILCPHIDGVLVYFLGLLHAL